jgi:hypothetical protein
LHQKFLEFIREKNIPIDRLLSPPAKPKVPRLPEASEPPPSVAVLDESVNAPTPVEAPPARPKVQFDALQQPESAQSDESVAATVEDASRDGAVDGVVEEEEDVPSPAESGKKSASNGHVVEEEEEEES